MTYSLLVLLPGVELQKLKMECKALQRHYISQESEKTRSSQMNKYYKFCESYHLDPAPCPSHQVAWYVTYMARTLRPVSIRNYVCALGDFLKTEGFPPIDYSDVGVYRSMAGASRTLGEAVRRAAPILPVHLLAMFEFLSEEPIHNVFRAALLTSFRALLRKQNVTVSDAVLLRRNFKFLPWGMLIEVERSKTIQKKEKVLRIPVSFCPDNRLCAAYWTARHFREVPASPESPAFVLPHHPPAPLDYDTYQAALKHWCACAGLDPKEFSSHSLRRGGTTFIWLAGATQEEIQSRGDWSSDAYKVYLSSPLEERISRDIQVAATVAAVAAGHQLQAD